MTTTQWESAGSGPWAEPTTPDGLVGSNDFPLVYNLSLYRNDNFHRIIRLKSDATTYIDLTGCTAKAQFKDRIDGTLLFSATCTLLDQTNPDTKGGFDFLIPSGLMDNIPSGAVGRWDYEVTYPSGAKNTYLYGAVEFIGDITQ